MPLRCPNNHFIVVISQSSGIDEIQLGSSFSGSLMYLQADNAWDQSHRSGFLICILVAVAYDVAIAYWWMLIGASARSFSLMNSYTWTLRVAWASSSNGSWSLKKSILRELGGSTIVFYVLASEVTWLFLL